MSLNLKDILPTLLFTASEQNEYLESVSRHADAIGWHLGKVDILDFIEQLDTYFDKMLKYFKKQVNLKNLTIAFDETYIPYYGRDKRSNWIHGYKNNVKGASGSYKFMVTSVVAGEQRFVLSMLPMAVSDDSVDLVDKFLSRIKKYFHVSLVLLDRGFANKELAYKMELHEQKYIALCPKWKNVKRFLKEKISEIVEEKIIRKHREEHIVKMQYVLEYNLLDYDWVFLTNTKLRGIDLIRAYKTRWGIETTFRVMDYADIKSKSTNIVIRTFFFLISLILYNDWIEKREEIECTFTQFLDYRSISIKPINTILDEYKNAKQKLGIELTHLEEMIISFRQFFLPRIIVF